MTAKETRSKTLTQRRVRRERAAIHACNGEGEAGKESQMQSHDANSSAACGEFEGYIIRELHPCADFSSA
ncbi:MAG: hypothetical protein WBH24_21300 [Candidatus Acidiferrum sp.]|jgi:hypothetical protein